MRLCFRQKNVIMVIKNRGGIVDVVISFFRDFLSGPLYIVFVVISVIGICACIGYLAEGTIKQKEQEKKNEEDLSHVHLVEEGNGTGVYVSSDAKSAIKENPFQSVGNVGNASISNVPLNSVISNSENNNTTQGSHTANQ